MDKKYKSNSDLEKNENLKKIAIDLARNILEGEVGVIAGCIQMNRIGHELFDRPEEDEDFVIFIAIDSETDHLPTEKTSKFWDNTILKEKQIEINNIENYYRDYVFTACRSIIKRYCGV